MKFCQHCGFELNSPPKFCPNCGELLVPAVTQSNVKNTPAATEAVSSNDSTVKDRWIIGSILYENDSKKLLSWFLTISLFDIFLSTFYSALNIIPTSESISTPEVLIFTAILTLVPYLLFRYWAVPKKLRLPFTIYIILIIIIVLLAFTETSLVKDFELYLRKGNHNPLILIISAYLQFFSGVAFQALIAFKLMTTLDVEKQS